MTGETIGRRGIRGLGTLAALALCAAPGSAQGVQAQRAATQDPLALFRGGGAVELGHAQDDAILRSRRVALAQAPLGDTVALDLFDDVRVVAVREGDGAGRVWRGSLIGHADSDVRLARRGSALVGTVRMNGALYKITPTADGGHRVEQVDETVLPGCADGAHVPAGAQSIEERDFGPPDTGTGGSAAMSEDAGPGVTTIDVMVVYTEEARVAMGSADAVRALIDLAVDETNAAYEDSEIDVYLNLVHTGEVAYEETGNFSGDLAKLRDPSDGHMDVVHEWRDVYGADLVSMIVAGASYCGVGYVMANPSPSFESYGFSLVARGCATGYYSFAHELGHNMGCMHDHQHNGSGAFEYSFGHRNSTSSWRTIMAYSPGTRVRCFSNPNVSHQGEPTGTHDSHPEPADNARTINETASIVAGFREAGTLAYGTGKPTSIGTHPELSWDGLPSLSSGSGFQLLMNDAVPGQFGIVHRGVAPSDMPFRGGTLYVEPPVVGVRSFRTTSTGETVLPIAVTTDNVGTTDFFQFLFRDPGLSDGTSVGMTNGVKVTYVP